MKLVAFFSAFVSVLTVATGLALRRHQVLGNSMQPAFVPGDRLLAESVSYRLRAPQPGEVVIVRQPGAGTRKDLKRLAAGPGTRVEIRGEPHTLADDEWFVLGDNLDGSTDSRHLGPVRRRDILARVWFCYNKAEAGF